MLKGAVESDECAEMRDGDFFRGRRRGMGREMGSPGFGGW
jgi:hypothetical protein